MSGRTDGRCHDNKVLRQPEGPGRTPCPVGRGPLSPRQDIPVPTRQRAIHGALVAAPGRQAMAHLDVRTGASVVDALVRVLQTGRAHVWTPVTNAQLV